MISLTPAKDNLELRQIREKIELCGKNRGPHDYIPIEWKTTADGTVKRTTRFLCRVCFCNVTTATLINQYEDISTVENIHID